MIDHSKSTRREPKRPLAVAIAATVTSLVLLVGASSALAEPKGIFKVFNDCPVATAGNALCQYAETTSGEVSIGTTKVPITQTITLQGGAKSTGGPNPNEYFLLPAKDGNTLSKTELNVPGGLAGLINCAEITGGGLLETIARNTCKAVFENKTTGVTATTELVANSGNPAVLNLATIFEEEGTGLVLPIRVHLKNVLLGEGCYIGSGSSPIQLQLTTGTTAPPEPNKPIKGKFGVGFEEIEKGQEKLVVENNSLVDNAFSAPVAEGCGGILAFILDPLINSKVGLPAASGHNTAVLNGKLQTATQEAVVASESF